MPAKPKSAGCAAGRNRAIHSMAMGRSEPMVKNGPQKVSLSLPLLIKCAAVATWLLLCEPKTSIMIRKMCSVTALSNMIVSVELMAFPALSGQESNPKAEEPEMIA